MKRRSLLALPFALRAAPRVGAPVTLPQPNAYHGWPTLGRMQNGTLVLVYSGGREAHVCPFGRVELMVSHDEGSSWSWPRAILDSDLDDRDAGFVETAKGTLLVSTFTSLAYEAVIAKAANRERWEAVHRRLPAARRKEELGCWMLRSADAGVTWSAPYRVPVNSPHGPLVLQDGRLLYAGKDLWGGGSVGVYESKDDGLTWSPLSSIRPRAGDDVKNYHELHMVEATPGRLILQIRNHNTANRGETLQCESEDGGRSFATPRAIGVWGLPSHLLRLRDGRLLMSYGYRRQPFGIEARISDNRGQNWGSAISLYRDGASVDLGYPSTVELGSGQLLTVWYELPAGGAHAVLRQLRWSING